MKKLLLSLLMAVMSIAAWAQDPDWSVSEFTGSITDNSTTINEATWTLSDLTVGSNTNGEPAWTISSKKWKFGSSKSQFWSSYTVSTDKFKSVNVTKVEIGCYDNGGCTSKVTVKQGDITIGSAEVSTNSVTSKVLNAQPGEGGVLKIIYESDKQASYITSIKVWYTLGGDAVHVESVSLDQSNLTIMVSKKATLTATVSPVNATNQNVSWSSSDEEVATVEKGVVKALKEGTATITVTSTDGNKTDECVVNVVPKTAPADAVFYESFDQMNGNGGNDDVWSGITQTPDLGEFDNAGWTTEGLLYAGAQCVSIRKGTDSSKKSIISGLTTPAIGVAGDGNVVFNAQSWGTDTGDFYVDIIGDGTFTGTGATLSNSGKTAKVALTKKSEWGDYDLNFVGLAADSKFRFYMAAGKRGFLDEVAVWVNASVSLNAACTDGVNSFGTYSNAYAWIVPSGLTVSVVGVDEEGKLVVSDYEEGDVIAANSGVMISGAAGNYDIALTTKTAAPAPGVNNLHPSSEAMTGDNLFYRLTMHNGTQIGFWWGAEGGAAFTLAANKAYLAVPNTGARNGFWLGEETNGLEAIETSAATTIYTLDGVKVNELQKGLNIVNGKKVMVK